MAHRTRLETLFEGDDAPVVHYTSNYKPRSLPSRPTNAKQFPSLANHYHTVHGHYNYPITTILEDPIPSSTKYLDLPQQQLQQYHARGTTSSPTTPNETITPQQQKFSLAHFWNRHLFTTPVAPPPQLSASPSSSPPPEVYRPTSAPPGAAPNSTSPRTSSHQQQHPRHPQRSASSSSSVSYTLSPSSSSLSSTSSSSSSSSESRLGSASSTCVPDSTSTFSPSSTTSSNSSTSLSNLVLGTISKRSSRSGMTLPFTSSSKSPSLASAPVPLTTSTPTGSPPSTATGKIVPLARSQSHSAVMVKRNSQTSVSSSVCPQQQQQHQHQQGVMHGGRRGREDQAPLPQQQQQQQQQHQAEATEREHDDQGLQQPHVLSIKRRVASGQAQLDHYRSMISQLDQQSSLFVQQQQELKEQRDHVARAVETLENVLHRPWQTTATTSTTSSIGGKDHATSRAKSVLIDSEEAKQALAVKLGRRRSLPSNAHHAGDVRGSGRQGGEAGQGQGGGGGRGLFVFTQSSLWSNSSSSHSAKAVVLHSHDVGDAEKDDTDDMFVHPAADKRSSYPGSTSLSTALPSVVSPPNSADSNTSRHSRDDPLYKADCERCILKDELLQKRGALQQIQSEIERLQQRLNSCASQVRMIQRTFVGPIEQHLAMDEAELGRIERAIGTSA